MKNFLLVTCLLIVSCTGCSKQDKGCMTVKPEAEEPQIVTYAAADSIHATKHSSGIYYEIIDPGSGSTANLNSRIKISYIGKFLSGAIFDQGTNENKEPWKLNSLIEGWQIGIPLIKSGGRIKLIIPSAYGYGCNPRKDDYGNVIIPGNSVLYFDVTLIDVQ